MELHFEKWEGTGNDFILVDDRSLAFPVRNFDLIRRLCDRHFGIGSDGLILIQPPRSADLDYHMEFFNPDASQSFCGNGSRCAFAFWRSLMGDDPGSVDGAHSAARFTAIDGEHRAEARGSWEVGILMRAPSDFEQLTDHVDHIHTGSPHLLVWVTDPEALDIISEAHRYRYNERFAAEGVNVNFVHWNADASVVEMRTYERGVEAETLSCGTGVTAAALDAIHRGHSAEGQVSVRTRGGRLRVEASGIAGNGLPSQVTLIGPVRKVFRGVTHH